MNSPSNRLVSVVTPIFNEQDLLPQLRDRLVSALTATGLEWEIILVNDGSADSSAEVIRGFHAAEPRIKLIDLSRNFGHQPAITAGVHAARGDCVILIDGDLQDPPEAIPEMVCRWQEGYQVVIGERRSRRECGLRGMGFRLFYPILRRMTDLPNAANAGVFGLMDRAVADVFNRLPERNRFIPGLRTWLGFRQTSVLYDRQARAAGGAKQTLRRLIRYAMDGIISFSYKPLRVATYMGFIVSIGAFLLALVYFTLFFALNRSAGSGFTTIILCVLFLGGVQLICLGVLGEYVGRIYEEIKQRPLYVVKETVGLKAQRAADA